MIQQIHAKNLAIYLAQTEDSIKSAALAAQTGGSRASKAGKASIQDKLVQIESKLAEIQAILEDNEIQKIIRSVDKIPGY